MHFGGWGMGEGVESWQIMQIVTTCWKFKIVTLVLVCDLWNQERWFFIFYCNIGADTTENKSECAKNKLLRLLAKSCRTFAIWNLQPTARTRRRENTHRRAPLPLRASRVQRPHAARRCRRAARFFAREKRSTLHETEIIYFLRHNLQREMWEKLTRRVRRKED